jgi:hypothetical protein
MSYYLDIAKEINLETLVQRGQKLFLDGKVVRNSELIENWFSYTIESYEVICPTLHLLSGKELESGIFYKLSKCQCEYHKHYDFCQHVFAVLAFLDDKYSKEEFKNNLKAEDFQSTDIWKSISQGEKSSIINNYIFQFRALKEYTRSDSWSENTITKNLGNLPKDLQKYPEIEDFFKNFLSESFKDFKEQKKAISLLVHPYLISYDGKKWLSYFTPYLPKVHQNNSLILITNLYENLANQIIPKNLSKDVFAIINSFPIEKREEAFITFREVYSQRNELWIEYCFKAKLPELLIKNIDLLDPINMIKIIELDPTKADLVERKVFNHAKVCSDFLPNGGDYQDILELFDIWHDLLGKTPLLEEAIEYFKEFHPKKRSLLLELSKF